MRYRSPEKAAARKHVLKAYTKATGRQRLPGTHQYWALCNDQTGEDSELSTLLDAGFLSRPEQFIGVDQEEKWIEQNKEEWPDAKWFHGEWCKVLLQNRSIIRPSLIHLDTVCYAQRAMELAAVTMSCFPIESVLALNYIESNCWIAEGQAEKHADVLSAYADTWMGFGAFTYNASGRSTMKTLMFKRVK